MVFRLLIAAIAIFLVILLIKRLRRSKQTKPETPKTAYEETVTCKKCGLRLPKAHAIEHKGDYFCCREHIQD
jgi:predicted nucleic acid binding AN1-type Zn finger protein